MSMVFAYDFIDKYNRLNKIKERGCRYDIWIYENKHKKGKSENR